MGNKEQMNSFIKNYIQNGYIIANMGYTLLNSVYKYMLLISSSLLFFDIGLSSLETEDLLCED